MPRKKKEGIYERKDSPYWWASYIDGRGQRVRRSTGVSVGEHSRDEAEALLAKWKMEAHQQRMWGKEPEEAKQTYTFGDVMLAYLQGHKTRSSMQRRRNTIKPLYLRFKGRDMTTITDLEVKEYVRDRLKSVQPATINKEVGIFSAACNYCRDELGWAIPNPAAKKKLREPEGIVRWLEGDEAERLIEAARARPKAHWLADYIQLSLYTGMRSGEVVNLRWEDINLEHRLIILDTGTTKNGRRRSVPLHPKAVEALEGRLRFRNQHCPESPWVFCRKNGVQVKDMKKSFAAAKKEAGITDFRRHDQRHTLASWMVMSGTELIKVRDMLGHSSTKLTERYAHLHPDMLRQAVDKLKPARNSHASRTTPFVPVGISQESKQIH